MLSLNNLKTITQEQLDEMIEAYEKWSNEVFNEIGNKYERWTYHDERLVLFGYNLSNLKIKNKDLQCIAVSNCLLNNVSFENCNLECANIGYSKIINTNFINCNLSYGDFLHNEFSNSDLSTCNIKNSHFDNALFNNTKMPDYPMACPERGNFIGYKEVYNIVNNKYQYFILKLEIPEDAKRSSAASNKCRCDKAKILEIQNLNGKIVKRVTKVRSIYNYHFIYELDKTIEEPKFDECRWHECTSGIHFFMNREEAVNYMKF